MGWGKKPKYGAKRVSHAGYSFHSKGEAGLFDLLKLMEKAGELSDIKTQDVVYLTEARIMYKPDFRVLTKAGETEWHEYKGFETPEWRIKRRLWIAYGPGKLHVWKGSGKSLQVVEVLG